METTERRIERWARGVTKTTCASVSVVADGDRLTMHGHGPQWWTPSGRTRVYHPRAYGWRTMYVHATWQIDVPLAALPIELRLDVIRTLVTGLRRPIRQTKTLRTHTIAS